MSMNKIRNTAIQTFSLVLLRILIGWHLLYEGIVKLIDPHWSAKDFLQNAQGPLSDFFQQLAANNSLLLVIDFLNIWGLILIGLSLMLGFLTRLGTLAGMILLLSYYFANPPFMTTEPSVYAEGSYLIVNKNLIEFAALFVLFSNKAHKAYGIDRFFDKI